MEYKEVLSHGKIRDAVGLRYDQNYQGIEECLYLWPRYLFIYLFHFSFSRVNLWAPFHGVTTAELPG